MSDPTQARQQELEALYAEIQEKQKRLNELLRQHGPEPVRDYELGLPDGRRTTLCALFGDKQDLIVVHNMGTRCAYCTLWADGFNGVVPHLEDRAGFVVVSPDEPDVQRAFAEARGWRFRMASAAGTTFPADMGYMTEHEGEPFPLPGFSTFRKKDDGSIERVAHAPFGPGDPYCGVFHLFALLEGGVGAWHPKLGY